MDLKHTLRRWFSPEPPSEKPAPVLGMPITLDDMRRQPAEVVDEMFLRRGALKASEPESNPEPERTVTVQKATFDTLTVSEPGPRTVMADRPSFDRLYVFEPLPRPRTINVIGELPEDVAEKVRAGLLGGWSIDAEALGRGPERETSSTLPSHVFFEERVRADAHERGIVDGLRLAVEHIEAAVDRIDKQDPYADVAVAALHNLQSKLDEVIARGEQLIHDRATE